MLFTASKTETHFPRYEPKSALSPENGSLRFHSSLRKLLLCAIPQWRQEIGVIVKTRAWSVLLVAGHLWPLLCWKCFPFFRQTTVGDELIGYCDVTGGWSQCLPTDRLSTVQLFFSNKAKCYYWLPISWEICVRFWCSKKQCPLSMWNVVFVASARNISFLLGDWVQGEK